MGILRGPQPKAKCMRPSAQDDGFVGEGATGLPSLFSPVILSIDTASLASKYKHLSRMFPRRIPFKAMHSHRYSD